MSIASEIQRLQGVRTDIFDAIAAKGVTVPSGAKLADCPSLISSISGGISADNIVNIIPINKIAVVDANGYIGLDLTNYFQNRGATFYYNYAILSACDNFEDKGLGQVTFYTPSSNNIGGRVYNTVVIGGKEWLAENLDFKFRDVAIGPSGSPSSPAAWYYNNDEATYGIDGTRKCGLLYNWYACKLLNDNRSTLCPGWHVPTQKEWDDLATAVGGASTAGTKLKAANVPWATSWGGTDDYGFGALPAGRWYSGFDFIGSYADFWTADESSSSSAYYSYFDTEASMNSYYYEKSRGYSVRLVKDSA